MSEEIKEYVIWVKDLDPALSMVRTMDLLGLRWSMWPKQTLDGTVPGYQLAYALKPDEDLSYIVRRAERHMNGN